MGGMPAVNASSSRGDGCSQSISRTDAMTRMPPVAFARSDVSNCPRPMTMPPKNAVPMLVGTKKTAASANIAHRFMRPQCGRKRITPAMATVPTRHSSAYVRMVHHSGASSFFCATARDIARGMPESVSTPSVPTTLRTKRYSPYISAGNRREIRYPDTTPFKMFIAWPRITNPELFAK